MDLIQMDSPWEAPVFYIESTTSTMDLACDFINEGTASGTVILAGNQTRGRGRFLNRKWESIKKQNLLFTLILSEKEYSFSSVLIPLLAGFSLHQMLFEEFNIHTAIKWPNDVLHESRKIAGILCESRSDNILVGIGLNCNQVEFPSFGKITPDSMKLILKKDVDIRKVLEFFLNYFYRNIKLGYNQEAVNNCLYNKSQIVRLSLGTKLVTGELSGISKEGALLIKEQNSEKERAFYSGEILYD